MQTHLCRWLCFLLSVDDLALCLYPPMDYNGVETNVRHTLSSNGIKNVLVTALIKSSQSQPPEKADSDLSVSFF